MLLGNSLHSSWNIQYTSQRLAYASSIASDNKHASWKLSSYLLKHHIHVSEAHICLFDGQCQKMLRAVYTSDVLCMF